MFLKAVYRHSKILCAAILLFFILQLLVDAKRGMVFAPFFHYGMYSKPQHLGDTLTAWLILEGKDTLRGHDFSPSHWDKLTYVPARIEAWNCRNELYETQLKRLLAKAGVNGPRGEMLLQSKNPDSAVAQYKHRLKRYFRLKDSLTVAKHFVVWKNNRLVSISGPKPISTTCR